MSGRSDLEDSGSESSTNREDLEVQLYSLVHYTADATEDTNTETNETHNQQNSVNEDQISSTASVQNPSQTVNVNSDNQPATEQNEPLCIEKHTILKKTNKRPEKIIDYLALLKEYKAAKAQHNFAEMSRNRSLMWFHKQQNLAGGYRKRYWMKDTSDHSDNTAMNHNPNTSLHVFHNTSYSNNRNEEISSRAGFSTTSENAETYAPHTFNDYAAFHDSYVTEYNGSSPPKKPRNSPDSVMHHLNHNTINYETLHKKKKKKKHKHKKAMQNASVDASSMQNANIDASSTADKTSSSKSEQKQISVQGNREKQQNEMQETHIMNHSSDKNFTNDDVDSRYNIVLSKKDDIIVLDSSDSESSIVILGTPPPPEPPPVICLDSDNENVKQQQETSAASQELVLNVATPKQPFKANIQENNELKDCEPTCSTSKANSSNSVHNVSSRAKRHQSMNGCPKWTAEMMTFYNESWGGERFDVISLQHRMSNNPAKWRVSQQDFQMGIYQRRYKDKCTNCNQFGHVNWHCPEPPRPLSCKMCGERGHTEPRCPFPICLQCGRRTMVYIRSCKDCRSKTFCTVCNQNGHSHDTCPEVWRKYCTTTCSSQVRKACGPVYKPKEQQWCCVCAKKGHFPGECHSFYVEPITFRINNEIHTPVEKKKKKKKNYMGFHKKKVHSHFGMPC